MQCAGAGGPAEATAIGDVLGSGAGGGVIRGDPETLRALVSSNPAGSHVSTASGGLTRVRFAGLAGSLFGCDLG